MAEISLILFDLNGVIYRYDRAARIACLSAVSGMPADDVRRAIWDSGFEDAGDSGVHDAAAYLREFGVRIGHDLSEADWVAAQQAALAPVDAAVALLPRIRIGVASAVLTNNNLLVRRHFATLYPEAARFVGNRGHVSAEFGARKPDPEVYRRCLARLGRQAEVVLFVDDSAANVAGARQAGLHAYQYTDPGALALELQARGLL